MSYTPVPMAAGINANKLHFSYEPIAFDEILESGGWYPVPDFAADAVFVECVGGGGGGSCQGRGSSPGGVARRWFETEDFGPFLSGLNVTVGVGGAGSSSPSSEASWGGGTDIGGIIAASGGVPGLIASSALDPWYANMYTDLAAPRIPFCTTADAFANAGAFSPNGPGGGGWKGPSTTYFAGGNANTQYPAYRRIGGAANGADGQSAQLWPWYRPAYGAGGGGNAAGVGGKGGFPGGGGGAGSTVGGKGGNGVIRITQYKRRIQAW